jgi:uncharacterized protein (DUF2225 family)
MKKVFLTAAVMIALLAPRSAQPTTWASVKKACPVCGHQVAGHSPASYGSYIYRWASKQYLIFWPWTDGHFWWLCTRCGYAALGGDFPKLTAKQKSAVQLHVKGKWRKPKSINFGTKMRQAEACYKHRGKKPKFWITFYRALAWNFKGSKPKTAALYRGKAVKLMAQQLTKKGLDGRTRKELNYLLGEFYRIDGKRPKAITHLKKALKIKWAVGGKVSAGGNNYVNDLIKASLRKLKVK